ncbi:MULTISPECIES: hypothetical protein [Moorena]|uniref:Filamentous haemagglutinin FhaB/tRNA nuclease CdiA-like TPS domain-containing protein n=1 Tax=Moorena producens 3L TaxID=489825 RepID=F4XVF9_9CYAN|nr:MULTISPECIES: hypothetical protein [Moorena]EGJ31507.1 hypothetical protein LYNGBM3L_39240 [Moorena producens 3L]NEP30766.1 hypothetical protein [Moorena sp. SIO3B2]NEP65877.1 hypothetical protein [Moorena sp. SIO3A5]NEQ07737.1 hypothetical protein [Moorena sp. SIO4E2]OLT68687.1 hypothetical protein BI334_30045 [Moorena producens 3L]
MTLVPPKVGGLGGQNSVSKNFSDILLDVAGSFVASTADSAVFDNGFNFSASNPQAPPLLTINIPIGLQYGSNPGSVNVTGATLTIETGQTMALLGGEVNLNGATLQVPGGRVELGGLSSRGTVTLNGATSVSFPDGVQPADISLTNSSLVDLTLPALEGRGFLFQRGDLLSLAGARKNRGLLSPSVVGL